MTQYLNPVSVRPFLDANGDPYSGAKLFIYSAGSSTKVTTTKDQAGTSNHTNPIILNNRGEIADGSGVAKLVWQTGGTSVDMVLAPSIDTDPPASPILTLEDVSGINDATVIIDQWVAGPTPTYVSSTSFTLVGDQTSTFHVGRRLKLTDSGGTDYATITASAYTSLTTVTVEVDSGGALDSGLSAVYYGVLSKTGHAVPDYLEIDTRRPTSDTNTITFSSLDGNSVFGYRLQATMPTGSVGGVLEIYVNGDTNATNYVSYINGGTGTPGCVIGNTSTSNMLSIDLEIKSRDGYMTIMGRYLAGFAISAGSSNIGRSVFIHKTATITNLTSITIDSAGGSGNEIPAGSVVRLSRIV